VAERDVYVINVLYSDSTLSCFPYSHRRLENWTCTEENVTVT